MILPRPLGLSLCLLLAAASASAAAASKRAAELAVYFEPFRVEQTALAPDGKHLAFSEHIDDQLFLSILDLDANTVQRQFLAEDEVEPLSGDTYKTPARLTYLRWANPDCLVFNLKGRNLWAINAQGDRTQELTTPLDFENAKESQRVGRGGSGRNRTMSPRGLGARISVTALPPPGKFLYATSLKTMLKIDVASGDIADDRILPAQSRVNLTISDQQGQPRIGVSNDRLEAIYTYEYLAQGGSVWKPLEEYLGKGSALTFHYDQQNYLGERAIPLAFDAEPHVLYYASNQGRDTFGIYALDLKTKQPTGAALEQEGIDLVDGLASGRENLVFDPWTGSLVGVRYTALQRKTIWLQPDLAKVQAMVTQAAPQKNMEIVDWDAAHRRFLMLGWNSADPGVYYIFDRERKALDERMRRAPALTEQKIGNTTGFVFAASDGLRVTAYLTLPSVTKVKTPPLLVYLHDGPWSRDLPGFNRRVQAFAAMGFAVLQVNYRGSRGFGRKYEEALRGHFDTGPLGDVLTAVDKMVGSRLVHGKLVAVIGSGYGGYLALRALQLYPDRFRCAVTIDAPTDLDLWLRPNMSGLSLNKRVAADLIGPYRTQLAALSPLTKPELITKPVLIVQSDNNSSVVVDHGKDLRNALVKCGQTPEYMTITHTAGSLLPGEQGELFDRMEAFLNMNIYDWAVKTGEAVRVGVE